jgi:hypothetical protein
MDYNQKEQKQNSKGDLAYEQISHRRGQQYLEFKASSKKQLQEARIGF